MKKVHPAVKAVIQHEDKYLVLKQEFFGEFAWDFPGGKVKYGENPYDTLHREVMEETGLSIDIVKPLGLSWFFRLDDDQVVCTVFLCTTESLEVDITQDPDKNVKTTEYRWVTKEEFLSEEYKVCHESVKGIFDFIN